MILRLTRHTLQSHSSFTYFSLALVIQPINKLLIFMKLLQNN